MKLGEMVNLLREHELALGELYSVFARRVSGHSDFWTRLATEERAHAEVLKMLNDRMALSLSEFEGRPFTAEGVKSSIQYVRSRTDAALSEEISHLRALAAAADLERTVIEREFFKVFASASQEIRNEFRALEEHTLEHRRRIEEALAVERSKQF